MTRAFKALSIVALWMCCHALFVRLIELEGGPLMFAGALSAACCKAVTD